ncbi:MAG TPA: type II secretion system protein GspG [Chthonomonadaceae bacterium]|nr:type II secretion system protein GspG [Chthonomonadaceae bacterium]
MTKRQANNIIAGIVAILAMQILSTWMVLRGQERQAAPQPALASASGWSGAPPQPLAEAPPPPKDPPQARTETAAADLSNFGSALQMYYVDTGHYPNTADGLTALVRNVAHEPEWKGPYLHNTDAICPDPWGRPYRYTGPRPGGPQYRIESEGDGETIAAEEPARP